MSVDYQSFSGLPPEPVLTSLLDLLATVFPNQRPADWLDELTYYATRSPMLTVLALNGGQVVGCKIGYERKPEQFYSWLGCVDPAFRGSGIATELMRQQHDWCRVATYRTIRTTTYNQWRSMLLLNLRQGFDIIGTEQGKRGLAILLEKRL